MNRKILQLLATAGAAIACASAEGSVLLWANPAGGSAGTATNWNPAQIPSPADALIYNMNVAYTVTFPATVATTQSQSFNSGNVTLSASSPHIDNQQFVVGLNPASNATVNITSGVFTIGNGSSGILAIGGNPTGTGVLNVTSVAEVFVNSTSGLRVGNTGNGTLNVTGGGYVEVQGTGPIQIGAFAGSQGTVLVSGFGAAGTSHLEANSATTGDLTIGVNGPGSLTVAGGADVRLGHLLSIAPNAGVTGSLTLGVGTSSGNVFLGAGADLHIAHNTTALAAGMATLNIPVGDPFGGQVTAPGTTFVGDADGGSGTLNMAAGRLITRTLVIDPVNGHLNHTGGILTITSGGSFITPGNGYILDGVGSGPTTEFHGSTGTLSGGFRVGQSGGGHLILESGAVVTVTNVAGSQNTIGNLAGATGIIDISGAGTRLVVSGLPTGFTVGGSGHGTLNVTTSGVLNAGSITVASNIGSQGIVRVLAGGLITASTVQIGRVGGGVGSVQLGSSSNFNCSNLFVFPGSTLSIDDAVLTVAGQGINTADLRGSTTIANGGELAADVVLVSGAVQASGNLYGDVTILPGGTVTAGTGDLFIGSPSNSTTGFVNQGTLDVAAGTVHIMDGDASPGGSILIGGGQLIATGLALGAGNSLFGHGNITAPITATGATFSLAGPTLVFNAPVNADASCTWNTLVPSGQFAFAAGGDFTGAGIIGARVTSEEEAAITATGALTLGNDGINDAVRLFGTLQVGSNPVTLRSNTHAILGVLTSMTGGALAGPASNARNIHSNGFPPAIPPSDRTVFDIVPLELPAGDIIQGFGQIVSKLVTRTGSTVTATGPLSLVGSEFPGFNFGPFDNGDTFADWAGNLNVGPHAVTFTAHEHRFSPTANVTMAGGSIAGPSLLFFGTLTGTGAINVTGPDALVRTAGTTRPGGAAIGTMTVNNAFTMLAGTFVFEGAQVGTLEMDISGDQGFAHDSIIITHGDATLAGKLTVHLLDAEPAPGVAYPLLVCQNGAVTGVFDTLNFPTLSRGSLFVRYTSNTVEVFVCPADFNQDGSLDPDDLADFIGAFFAQPPGAGSDFNADGTTDPDDLADFIGAFFQGCG